MELPTVVVIEKASGNVARINVADFDESLHELAEKGDAPKVKKTKAEIDAETKAQAENAERLEKNAAGKKRGAPPAAK